MNMKKNVRVQEVLGNAERERRCAFASDKLESEALQRGVASGRLCRPYPGLFADTQTWQSLDPFERIRWQVRALSLKHPDWVYAASTAAVLYGLECPWELCSGKICVVTDRRHRHSSSNTQLCYVHTPGNIVARCEEFPVTSVVRTLVDCGLRYPFREVLPMYDSALRNGLTSMDEVCAVAETVHKAGPVRRLARYANGLSENGGESFCRGTMIEQGFPEPRLQVEFKGADGSKYRVDFLFVLANGRSVVVEYDGMQKYQDVAMTQGKTLPEVVVAEQNRERALLSYVSQVVRVTYDDVKRRSPLVSKLSAAGIPRRF